jgi:hypothetical protein
MSSVSYGASSTKRTRRTKEQMGDIREAITAVLANDNPMTVRQVFYQLVVKGAIEKTEAAYNKIVVRLLSEVRLSGAAPWRYITDESRRTRQTETFDNVADALSSTAKFYRRSASHQFGDHDPSGGLIPKVMRERLTEFCEQHNIDAPTVERIALTPAQIARYRLPSRPTKREGNTHAVEFKGRSTELDALPVRHLRALVRGCIEHHIDPQQVEVLRAAEDSERGLIEKFAKRAAKAGAS